MHYTADVHTNRKIQGGLAFVHAHTPTLIDMDGGYELLLYLPESKQ